MRKIPIDEFRMIAYSYTVFSSPAFVPLGLKEPQSQMVAALALSVVEFFQQTMTLQIIA